MLKKTLMASGTAIAAVGLFVGTAATASAATGFTHNGVNIRACDNTSCTIYGEGYIGQTYTEHQLAYGQMINCGGGWLTSAWYYITDNNTGVTGWASACYL